MFKKNTNYNLHNEWIKNIVQHGGLKSNKWKKLKIFNIQDNMLKNIQESKSLETTHFDFTIDHEFKIIDFSLKKEHEWIKNELWYPLCTNEIYKIGRAHV